MPYHKNLHSIGKLTSFTKIELFNPFPLVSVDSKALRIFVCVSLVVIRCKIINNGGRKGSIYPFSCFFALGPTILQLTADKSMCANCRSKNRTIVELIANKFDHNL